MVFLGIDYGERHVGLAISSEGFVSRPLHTISRKKALDTISTICTENTVATVIIGLPDGEISKRIRLFGKLLQKRLNVPVIYWDETLSTKRAIQALIASGVGQKKRREKEHTTAAALILQSYLDRNKK